MAEQNWTPGEWLIFGEPVTGGYRIQTKEVRGIATATQRDEHPLNGGGISWEEAEANAHLMRSAKDLYEALEEAEKDLVAAQVNARRAAKHDTNWNGVAEAIQPSIDKSRAARAKARGK